MGVVSLLLNIRDELVLMRGSRDVPVSASFLFVMILPFILPEATSHLFPFFFDSVVLPWKVGSLFILLFISALSLRIDGWIVLVLVYCVADVGGTLLGGASVIEAIKAQLSSIAMVLAMAYAIRANEIIGLLRIIRWYFFVEIYLNLLTVIAFPDGIYVTTDSYYNPFHWLMGFDNIHVLSFVFALGSSLVVDHFDNGLDRLSWCSRLILLVSLVTVLTYWSATSMIVLFVATFLLMVRRQLTKAKWFSAWSVVGVLILCSILLASGVLSELLFNGAQVLFSASDKGATISSRFGIWRLALDGVQDHLLFGLGWQDTESLVSQLTITHAHNQIIEDLYTGGLFKVMLLGLILLSICRSVSRLGRTRLYTALVIILAAFMIRWLVESMNMDLQLAFFTIMFYAPIWSSKTNAAAERQRIPRCVMLGQVGCA